MTPSNGISPVVLGHLSQARCRDNHCMILPMSREDHAAVDRVLQAMGAKWNRTAYAHVFPHDVKASAAIVAVCQTKTIPQPVVEAFQATPDWLADVMVRIALCEDLRGWLALVPKPYTRGGVVIDFEGGDLELPIDTISNWPTTLEPSAGDGALLSALCRQLGDVERPRIVRAVESNQDRVNLLKKERAFKHVDVACGDFLKMNFEDPFKCIIMNPPRGRGSDVEHISKAINLLDMDGVLVAVASAKAISGKDTPSESLRNRIISRVGAILALPEDTFHEDEKPLKTVLLILKRVR